MSWKFAFVALAAFILGIALGVGLGLGGVYSPTRTEIRTDVRTDVRTEIRERIREKTVTETATVEPRPAGKYFDPVTLAESLQGADLLDDAAQGRGVEASGARCVESAAERIFRCFVTFNKEQDTARYTVTVSASGEDYVFELDE